MKEGFNLSEKIEEHFPYLQGAIATKYVKEFIKRLKESVLDRDKHYASTLGIRKIEVLNNIDKLAGDELK
ncbi:MAG: hypothetical protein JSW08_03095 [archaeon]|nr:MAG: hypothetical protein JSW08_03095 [archaeon]